MLTPNAEQIQSVILASDLKDALAEHDARINAAISQVHVAPDWLYCSKTGAPLSQISAEVLTKSLATLGRDKFREALFVSNCFAVSPQWFWTDNDALDTLMEHDPRGYAVYCLNLLTGKYLGKVSWNDASRIASHHWSLARAWQWVSLLSPQALEDLNYNLMGLLTYVPYTIQFVARELGKRAKGADDLARMALSGDLIGILENATNYALANLGNWQIATKKFQEVPTTVKQAARGPSQIKAQKAAKKRIEVDEFIAGFMTDNSSQEIFFSEAERIAHEKRFPKKTKTPSLIKRLQTLQNQSGAKNREPIGDGMLMDLAEMEFDFTDSEDTDENDDTVIVNKIDQKVIPYLKEKEPELPPQPVAEEKPKSSLLKKLQALPPVEPPKAAQPAKPMSLLQKLRKGEI